MVKRVLIVLGLLAGLGLTGFIPVLWLTREPPGPGVTRTRFEQVKAGMQEQEMQALLGGPPNYQAFKGSGYSAVWQGEEGAIAVWFTEEVVQSVTWHPYE